MENKIISKRLEEALASSSIDTPTLVCIIIKFPKSPEEHPTVLGKLVNRIESMGITGYTTYIPLRSMIVALTPPQVTELAETNDDGYITDILQHDHLKLKDHIRYYQ